MESPELENRMSFDQGAGGSSSSRPLNPNRDYKEHFNRQKERYNTVSSDQTTRKKELNRASQKQIKLQEEIEFLLDAIAGERHRRQLFHEGDGEAIAQPARRSTDDSPTSALDALADAAAVNRKREDIKPDTRDLGLAEETSPPSMSSPGGRPAAQEDGDVSMASALESAGTTAGVKFKRQRPSPTDTDDELLEAAGVSATKRSRQ